MHISISIRLTSFYIPPPVSSQSISKIAINWMKSEKIRALSCPANSPDLNLIETVWGMMKDEIQRHEPKSQDDLWQLAHTVCGMEFH